jgi:hypothetical protein
VVVEAFDSKEVDDAAMDAGFRITGAINQASEACLQHRSGAHRTGFQGHEQFATGQAIVS